MAKWASAAFLDGGIDYLKATATKLLLIKAYAAGDSYATVVGNKVAEVAMVSGDFTKSSVGNDRRLTSAAKSGVASSANSGATPNLHFAFTDGAANVLYVTDETTDQVVTAPNPVDFPALVYTSGQPT